MKKQLIIGIIIILLAVGLSGCNESRQNNDNEVVSQSQNQTVGHIVSFDANPDEITLGETVILQWNVTGAESVSIDNGIGTFPSVGNHTISPLKTTTYTLTAHFSVPVIIGSSKATVTIEVVSSLPVIISMEISEWNDTANTITWEVTKVEGGPVTDSDVDKFIVDENGHIASGQSVESYSGGLITQGRKYIATAPADGYYIFKITEKGFGDIYFQSNLTKY